MRWALLALAAITAPAPAHGEWLRAKSRHFVIYSDTGESELRALATRLERFDAAVRRIYGFPDRDEDAANPLTVYVADSVSAVEKLCGCSNIAGFYQPRATGAIAFTPRIGSDGGVFGLRPQTVLFHEYGHHLLFANSAAAVPAWFAEGSAELISTATVDADKVTIGHAANHRAYGLLHSQQLPLTVLFAPNRRLSDRERDQLYGRGWLLTHYATFNPQRAEQMKRYLAAFATGTPPLQAAKDAFGDLGKLDRELGNYLRGRLFGAGVPVSTLPAATVELRPLSRGEQALIDMRMVSERGVNPKTAAPLYARARKVSVPADDAVAQAWLAEMAFDAGQDAEAEAAADRALAADPRSIHALLYKARIRLRRAVAARSADPKIWSEARSWIVKANRVENNHAGALQLYYQSFEMANVKPSATAANGLRRALELVPQDPGLRFAVARQNLVDGRTADARRTLMPLAYSPHAAPDNPAARLIALIDQGKTGEAALAAIAPELAAETK